MIHISPDKNGFRVTKLAKNGEVLSQSESLKSKFNCWKNIKAELKSCYEYVSEDYHPYAVVQDDTVFPSKIWYVRDRKIASNGRKLHKPYIIKK